MPKKTPLVDAALEDAWIELCEAHGRFDLRVGHVGAGWFVLIQFAPNELAYVRADVRRALRECYGDPDIEADAHTWSAGLLPTREATCGIARRLAEGNARERDAALDIVFAVMTS